MATVRTPPWCSARRDCPWKTVRPVNGVAVKERSRCWGLRGRCRAGVPGRVAHRPGLLSNRRLQGTPGQEQTGGEGTLITNEIGEVVPFHGNNASQMISSCNEVQSGSAPAEYATPKVPCAVEDACQFDAAGNWPVKDEVIPDGKAPEILLQAGPRPARQWMPCQHR